MCPQPGRSVPLSSKPVRHRPRRTLWPEPDRFTPERFAEWDGGAYDLIPQDGGDHHTNHRCAGEWITIALMRHALRFLTQGMEYEVPAQDLSLRLSRLPAIPNSRFVITHVRPA